MDSEHCPLTSLSIFSSQERSRLIASTIKFPKDLLLTPSHEIAKKLKVSLDDVNRIIDAVCRELEKLPKPTRHLLQKSTALTTGDLALDRALGGGVRRRTLWELCGESSSGKTQLALQLALTVQLPLENRGWNGSCCYITTNGSLQTARLEQLRVHHPHIRSSAANLSRIKTASATTFSGLITLLYSRLPRLIQCEADLSPVKLVILDSIASLFHTNERTSTQSLVQRSRRLIEIATRLRWLAMTYDIAVVIINDVTDVFGSGAPAASMEGQTHFLYKDQIAWVNRAHSTSADTRKEASLGLVWSNQLDVRLMLTRTNRRKAMESNGISSKRRRVGQSIAQTYEAIYTNPEDGIVIRRLSILFSSLSKRNSLDYIVDIAGVSTVADANDEGTLLPSDSEINGGSDDVYWEELDVAADEEVWANLSSSSSLPVSEASGSPAYSGVATVTPEGNVLAATLDRHQTEDGELWDSLPDFSQLIYPDG